MGLIIMASKAASRARIVGITRPSLILARSFSSPIGVTQYCILLNACHQVGVGV